MRDALSKIGPRVTPQTERVPGRSDQVQNNAGGYGFQVDEWSRALRFIILGTDGGTYYVSERDLTKQNADFITKLANSDGERLVELIVDVSENARAPRQNPTLYALAACTASTDAATRQAAYAAISRVCRIGTHLFILAGYIEQFRGWSRGLRTAISDWYLKKPVDSVAYQAVKYRQREGWSHRDMLRLAHPVSGDIERKDLFDWICRGYVDGHAYPATVNGYELVQNTTTPAEWAKLVTQYNLPWEALPDAAMNEAEVWSALLPNTGLTALIRQLGRLTNIGIIAPLGGHTNEIVSRLTNAQDIKKARVHPLQILTALVTYDSGHGFRGQSSWTAVPKIVEALNEAFYLAFDAIEPANKRTLLGLDVSGSMTMGTIANSPLAPLQAEAAMAMVAIRTEPEVFPMAFSNQFVPLTFGATSRLGDVIKTMEQMPFGGTDCSLPMQWALQNRVPVDTFITYTDNETWAGGMHPFQALRQYRDQMGIDARMVVVGMTATEFTIADPKDAGMFDCVGFDSSAPSVINAFSRGEL